MGDLSTFALRLTGCRNTRMLRNCLFCLCLGVESARGEDANLPLSRRLFGCSTRPPPPLIAFWAERHMREGSFSERPGEIARGFDTEELVGHSKKTIFRTCTH